MFFITKCQIQSNSIKAQECSFLHSTKECLLNFYFVAFAAIFSFSSASFDIAMYKMKACNEQVLLKITEEYLNHLALYNGCEL